RERRSRSICPPRRLCPPCGSARPPDGRKTPGSRLGGCPDAAHAVAVETATHEAPAPADLPAASRPAARRAGPSRRPPPGSAAEAPVARDVQATPPPDRDRRRLLFLAAGRQRPGRRPDRQPAAPPELGQPCAAGVHAV